MLLHLALQNSKIPVFNSVHFWQGVVGTVAVLTFIAAFLAKPIKRWYDKRSLERQRHELFLDGMPGVEGFTKPIPPAYERMGNLETGMTKANSTLENHGEILETIVNTLIGVARAIEDVDSKVTPNGGDTNNPGDVLQRLAKATGVWVEEKKIPITRIKNENKKS